MATMSSVGVPVGIPVGNLDDVDGPDDEGGPNDDAGPADDVGPDGDTKLVMATSAPENVSTIELSEIILKILEPFTSRALGNGAVCWMVAFPIFEWN